MLVLAGGLVIVPLALYFMFPNSPHRRFLPLVAVIVVFLVLFLFVMAVGSIGG